MKFSSIIKQFIFGLVLVVISISIASAKSKTTDADAYSQWIEIPYEMGSDIPLAQDMTVGLEHSDLRWLFKHRTFRSWIGHTFEAQDINCFPQNSFPEFEYNEPARDQRSTDFIVEMECPVGAGQGEIFRDKESQFPNGYRKVHKVSIRGNYNRYLPIEGEYNVRGLTGTDPEVWVEPFTEVGI